MTNFSPPAAAAGWKQSACQPRFRGIFGDRAAGFRGLHRNAAEGCTGALDPVQESARRGASARGRRWW